MFSHDVFVLLEKSKKKVFFVSVSQRSFNYIFYAYVLPVVSVIVILLLKMLNCVEACLRPSQSENSCFTNFSGFFPRVQAPVMVMLVSLSTPLVQTQQLLDEEDQTYYYLHCDSALTYPLRAINKLIFFRFFWNDLITLEWIAVKFGTDIHGSRRINPTNFPGSKFHFVQFFGLWPYTFANITFQ